MIRPCASLNEPRPQTSKVQEFPLNFLTAFLSPLPSPLFYDLPFTSTWHFTTNEAFSARDWALLPHEIPRPFGGFGGGLWRLWADKLSVQRIVPTSDLRLSVRCVLVFCPH